MSELVTVIIPIYNVENYLHRCVDSILNQTYKNLEIILVDDGSPDNCGKISDDYALLDQRVKVIHKENGGLSDARNVGVDIAKGSYITFIDSDDWVHEDYIQKLYDLLIETNSDISMCDHIRLSSQDIHLETGIEEIHEFTNYEALTKLTGKLYVQMVVAWGKLYKSHLFKSIRFPVGRLHEDEFTTYKLIYIAKKIVYTTTPLLYYWQREDSIMGSGFNLKKCNDIIDAFEERALFFKKNNLNDLSDKTYERLFFIYMNINKEINEINLKLNQENDYNEKFKELKRALRMGNHKLRFRLFFELYYSIPYVMGYIYLFLKYIKNLKGGFISKGFQ